jgi:ribonuclease P protein component
MGSEGGARSKFDRASAGQYPQTVARTSAIRQRAGKCIDAALLVDATVTSGTKAYRGLRVGLLVTAGGPDVAVGRNEEKQPWPRASGLSSRTIGGVHVCTDSGCGCALALAGRSFPADGVKAAARLRLDFSGIGGARLLPTQYRMTRSAEFDVAVKRGIRAVQPDIIVHVIRDEIGTEGPRIGLIIGKSVGSAVQRHRVARRLRHVAKSLIGELDTADRVVIRALPSSRHRVSPNLERQLRYALQRARVLKSAES